MNAPARLFLNAPRTAMAAKLFGCVGACALTAACVSDPFAAAQVDPRSPVAAEVAKAANAPAAFPKFADIPHKPTNLRPTRAFGVAAAQVEVARAQLEQATAPETWSLKESDSFAAAARAAAGPDAAPADQTATEAFARDLRRRATPPPSPKR